MMDGGMTKEAVAEISRIIDLKVDPSDLTLRAVFHRDMGNIEAAKADMSLVLTLEPGNHNLRSWLEVYPDAALIAHF